MTKQNIYFYSCLILTLTVATLLATGSSLLTVSIDNNEVIPLGTIITWIGMIALPLTVYWGIKEMRKPSLTVHNILAGLLKIIILLGVLWVPISYLLAGNLSFTFTERETFQGGQVAMRWFWRLSYGIGIGSMLVLFFSWISRFLKKGV